MRAHQAELEEQLQPTITRDIDVARWYQNVRRSTTTNADAEREVLLNHLPDDAERHHRVSIDRPASSNGARRLAGLVPSTKPTTARQLLSPTDESARAPSI